MRDCSNATTGVSPYMLLYGRLPRGPLSVLKDYWSHKQELPTNFSKNEIQYMDELRRNLEIARKYASDYSVAAQERYVGYYNRNTKDKNFLVGDRVLLLDPDSANKVVGKWQEGVIDETKSSHSYLVDMPNGARRHIHASKLRPYVVAVNSVVLDEDKEFGRMIAMPAHGSDLLPSQKVTIISLSHLSDCEQHQLLHVLDEFPQCFADRPGFCNVVEHKIITLPGFVPKRAKAYKIPEILKEDVDRQIETLLKDGFIRPSTSLRVKETEKHGKSP
jgi:hypothetical protein